MCYVLLLRTFVRLPRLSVARVLLQKDFVGIKGIPFYLTCKDQPAPPFFGVLRCEIEVIFTISRFSSFVILSLASFLPLFTPPALPPLLSPLGQSLVRSPPTSLLWSLFTRSQGLTLFAVRSVFWLCCVWGVVLCVFIWGVPEEARPVAPRRRFLGLGRERSSVWYTSLIR